MPGVNGEESDQEMEEIGDDMPDTVQVAPEQAIHAQPQDWRRALKRVIPCVVAIKSSKVRSFDTSVSSTTQATGFIVDAQRGLLLTNRHVVTAGPSTAMGAFHNRELLPLWPVYYDPIHDFGFYRFNPAELRYMKAEEVALAPEEACVGLEVRVVGNDTKEKVSILTGTIARVDRDAPTYTVEGYNDFNTFYIQAASNTKGGSSGSPVIDSHGRAVGLNAGGSKRAASAFYLPLDRVVRALRLLQAANPLPLPLLPPPPPAPAPPAAASAAAAAAPAPAAGGAAAHAAPSAAAATPAAPRPAWRSAAVPRGDLLTVFVFKGFDDVQRLGLRGATEGRVRGCVPEGGPQGMLVVDLVVPGGPAEGVLEPGDVLVSVDGQVVVHFLRLEELLDDAVGSKVKLEVERGGVPLEVEVAVTDLHAVSPRRFLELGHAVLHGLSYQMARNYRLPPGQVYLADRGDLLSRAGLPRHCIITAVNDEPTPDLDSFAAAIKKLPHAVRVPIEYYSYSERHTRRTALFTMDRQWYGPPVTWTRDDARGIWIPEVEEGGPEQGVEGLLQRLAEAGENGAGVEDGVGGGAAAAAAGDGGEDGGVARELSVDQIEEKIRRSLVQVEVSTPHVACMDGIVQAGSLNTGLIVHLSPALGLVVTDKYTIQTSSSEAFLTFLAFPAEVPASPIFLHPLHNFALLAFDPRQLPPEARSQLAAASVQPDPPVKRGQELHLVVATRNQNLLSKRCTVTNASVSLVFGTLAPPRFRPVHEEVIAVDQDFGMAVGVLVDGRGSVKALYCTYRSTYSKKQEMDYCRGQPVQYFWPWLQHVLRCGLLAPHSVPVLDAELEPVQLSRASQFKLPREWVARLLDFDRERRQVLRVSTVLSGSPTAAVLKPGDMVLSMGGRLLTSYVHLDSIICAPDPAAPTSPAAGPPTSPAPAPPAPTSPSTNPPASPSADPANPATVSTTPAASGGDGCAAASPGEMQLVICRAGQVKEVTVQLGRESSTATTRVVQWCGALLQPPHRSAREVGVAPGGVYVNLAFSGSPASAYGVVSPLYLTELNGVVTPDLDAFLAEASKVQDGQFVRVKTCSVRTGRVRVVSVKVDLLYWPTSELRRDPLTGAWHRAMLTTWPPPL